MSELPEDKEVLLLIECKAIFHYSKWNKSLVIGYKCSRTKEIHIEEPENIEYPSNYYEGETRFLGWFYELPDLNDIKT